jgi:hypothetical protein
MSVDFKNVRDSYSLAFFFEGPMGASSKNVSGSVRYSACPNPRCGPSSDSSVKVSVRNNKWHCFACEDKGDVIDAAAAFFGMSLADAAKQLANDDSPAPARRAPMIAPEPRVERDQEAINEVIALLLRSQKMPEPAVVKYLESRGIPRGTCVSAVFRKMLITLPGDPNEALRYLLDMVGRDLLIKSGLWKQDSKCPAIVYRPLAFVNADKRGIEFRLIEESSVAMAKAIRYGEPSPCVWNGNGHAMVVEGGIDVLSAVVMGSERTIIGIPGAKNWSEDDQWLVSLRGKTVLIATDADNAGERGAQDLAKVFESIGTRATRHVLPDGCKDLNDQLKSQLN